MRSIRLARWPRLWPNASVVALPARHRAGVGHEPVRFGILTSGRVFASMTSCSPMMPLR